MIRPSPSGRRLQLVWRWFKKRGKIVGEGSGFRRKVLIFLEKSEHPTWSEMGAYRSIIADIMTERSVSVLSIHSEPS